MEQKKSLGKIIFLTAVVFMAVYLGVFLFQNSTGVVPPGMTGAKVTLGKVSPTPYEGFLWRWPFCSYVVLVDTKQQCDEYKSACIKTRDLQTISMNCSVIYQVNPKKVPALIKDIQPEDIQAKVLHPRMANALQETIGKNDVFLLITEQEMVREATKYILDDLLAVDGYISVKEVLFHDPKFSESFEKAVEQKMTEGQLLEVAKIQTRKVEEEARQLMAMASAEMEVLRQKNKILTNPLIMKYEATKALQKWKGDIPSTLVVSGNEGVLPVVPMTGYGKQSSNK